MVFGQISELFSSASLINLIAALIILIFGIIIAGILAKLTRKVLKELEVNKILRDQAGIRLPIEQFISNTIKYLIYLTAVIWALSQLGLTTTILQIILITLLVIFVIFIVLAFKDFIPNLVAGFLMHQRGNLKKGDTIRVKNIEGKITNIDLLETRLMTKHKEIVYVPNSYLMKHEVVKKG